jgi:DNA repair exonuclease SbcCD nuclease subunit
MVVCGDVFESNQVDRRTVARALEALKDVLVPVFLLPGNHDPLNAASVYRSGAFVERKPNHVKVVETSAPISVGDGVELVGAPWFSKRPAVNPVDEVLAGLEPCVGVTRICLAHGGIDYFTPDRESPGVIAVGTLERAISEGKVHFAALGDRHSLTRIGGGDRIWYSGTPEATDFTETQSGYAHAVEIDGDRVSTEALRVGQWRFIERPRVDLNSAEDVEALRASLEAIERKELSAVRLNLVGSLSLSLKGLLDSRIEAAKDVFGAFEVREDELMVLPDDADFVDLGFSGFADTTVKKLRALIEEGGDEGVIARDALMLLMRLAGGAA